jgi:predicted transcriptional regulator
MDFKLSQIKDLRIKCGLTQKDLAMHSGVSQSLIAKIEAGLIDPSYTNARKILDALETIGNKTGLKAKDIMNTHLISVAPDDTLKKAIQKMKAHGISQLPVIKERHSEKNTEKGSDKGLEKHAVGTISESVIVDALIAHRSHDTEVSEVMSSPPPTVTKDANMSILTELLKHYPLVLIREKERLEGVITKADIIMKAYK